MELGIAALVVGLGCLAFAAYESRIFRHVKFNQLLALLVGMRAKPFQSLQCVASRARGYPSHQCERVREPRACEAERECGSRA